MFVNNRLASLIYKVCIAVVCLVGVLTNSGIFSSYFAPPALLYYAVLSNFFCMVFYIVSASVTGSQMRKSGRYGVVRFVPHFKGAVVMGMLLNILFFIFIMIYTPFGNTGFFSFFSNILVNIITPLMVLADWAIFDRKGRFSGSDPIIWMVVPFVYYAIILLAAQMNVTYFDATTFYPYRFLDPDRILWAPVLVNLALIVAIYLALGYILMGVDKLLGDYAKRKALEAARVTPQAMFTGTDEAGNPYNDDLSGVDGELQNLNDLLTSSTASAAAPPPQTQQVPAPAAPLQTPPQAPAPVAPPQNNTGAGTYPDSGNPQV